ncbi:MgtC/SapB family protein [Paenibacillus aurantius]|uniref:MgtC/SapB family protein n=1 Tax=Paenibacillus aurantius TaxID=2918900 RepID=A0AA96LG71_9BACL|nr:MgtC/SapB family protein [Paenibacillus aurantius]WNQ12453.1 MgtC/SapB family protein [Paenibacillus aurantius]
MSPWVIEPVDLAVRLLLALLLGGLVGFEREHTNRPAGFRTHILVCLGSCLLMLISIYAFADFAGETNVRLDPSRLAAQVIPGIGFLGAGTIMRNGFSVTGLTTAASLWIVSAIGLAVGSGFYLGAFTATAMSLLSLWVFNKIEKKYFSDKRIYTLKIMTEPKPGTLGLISAKLEERGISVRKMVMEEESDRDVPYMEMTLLIKVPKSNMAAMVAEEIRSVAGVRSITLETG